MIPVPALAKRSGLGAQRRARIEVSSPAARILPAVPDEDHGDSNRPTSVSLCPIARHPNLGVQRRARDERNWSCLDNVRTVRCVSTMVASNP
jgi:hypothetical protein